MDRLGAAGVSTAACLPNSPLFGPAAIQRTKPNLRVSPTRPRASVPKGWAGGTPRRVARGGLPSESGAPRHRPGQRAYPFKLTRAEVEEPHTL